MSDGLIERLKAKVTDVENARGPAKHILNDRLADLGQVAWDHMTEIIAGLSALKTVQGIGSDYFRNKKGCNEAEECLNRLKDIAISRGQQLRERDAEIERLNKSYEWAMRERDAVTGELVALQNQLTIDEGQSVSSDNSEPPQVWVWSGDDIESAEPIRRLPFTRRQKPKEF